MNAFLMKLFFILKGVIFICCPFCAPRANAPTSVTFYYPQNRLKTSGEQKTENFSVPYRERGREGEKRKEREGRKRGSGGEGKGEGREGKRRGGEGKGEGRGPLD